MFRITLWIFILVLLGCGEEKSKSTSLSSTEVKPWLITPGKKADREIQRAFLEVKPGQVINIAAGHYEFSRRLTLDIPEVTVRGAGADKTIFSFRKQKVGSEGFLVTQGKFVLESLAIEDTKGDGIKVKGADNVTLRSVRVEWTRGPHEENGGYGIYPVQCQNVLIEKCIAIGASDAGIYVGQSKNIIVRNNQARKNVAGIEIENSRFADVYKNDLTENTGGILVFDLPNLPVMGGGHIRVFQNKVYKNNQKNFAAKGNIVAKVPTGTGMMVMANNQVEIFSNEVFSHQTTNLALVSYMATNKKYDDPSYDPYPEGIFIHDNLFSDGGTDPQGEIGSLLAPLFQKIPDIVWDGMVDPQKMVEGKIPAELGIYLKDNAGATFANFNLLGLLQGSRAIDRDIKKYTGELPSLSAVKLP